MTTTDELFATRRWAYFIPTNALVPRRGYRVSIVFESEPGHFPTGDLNFGAANHVEPWFWGMTYKDAEQEAAEQNQKLGHDVGDVWRIVASSGVSQ